MFRPTLFLLVFLTAATGARAEHRSSGCSDRGKPSSCGDDRRDGYGRWDDHDRYDRRERACDRDNRERCELDRYDRERCERRYDDRRYYGRPVGLGAFVLRAVNGQHYRDYRCGCRTAWRSGYYESRGYRGGRAWVPGRYETERTCRNHR